MALTETKLELLKQIRMEQDANIRDLQTREHILYGKTYSYPTMKTKGNETDKNHVFGPGIKFLFRCLLTVLLCTGIYFGLESENPVVRDGIDLLSQEQTVWIKELAEEWLTKNDLSFAAK